MTLPSFISKWLALIIINSYYIGFYYSQSENIAEQCFELHILKLFYLISFMYLLYFSLHIILSMHYLVFSRTLQRRPNWILKTSEITFTERHFTSSCGRLYILACIYLLKVNNRNIRTRCEICSKLTIKTIIVNFENISHLVLVFLLLTLSLWLAAGLIRLLCYNCDRVSD